MSRQETYQIMDRFFQGAKTSPACSRICVEASMDATWKIPVLTRCAGHQPNSRVLYTHYKDSLLKGGMTITSPMFQEFTKIGTHTTIHQPGLKLIKSRSKNTVHLHQLQIGPQLQDFFSHGFLPRPPFPTMTTLAARAASWSIWQLLGNQANQTRFGRKIWWFWKLEFSLAVLEGVLLRYETTDIHHAGGTILKSLMGKIDGIKQMI